MYNSPHFAEQRRAEIERLLRAHPLGTLVVQTADGLDAHHLPFLYAPAEGPHGTLRAHVARANPLWRQCRDGDAVLAIFRGPEAYVSPNWYPSKHEAHRQVPTWNYQVVHLHGRIAIRDDERFVRGVVARLTQAHEAGTGAGTPWKMGDAPPDYLDAMLAAIVGIEIAVERVEAKSKLSQNKDARDRLGAAEALQAQGRDALAQAMRQAPPPL
ncbi:FMN-binding negative transcriptional regulator [Pseudorhodoferax sp.]|uniref:FMN-binding negative transcriptional regulator n=1 Tax=Pseudorhodoferax sp. TaxID=1993553 RepID=UPI0039E46AC0